jgi:hypothetical protein
MRNETALVETVRTDETHVKDDPCALYDPDHEIAVQFDRVLVAAQDALNADVSVVAGGCNGCTLADVEDGAYIYYLAQTDAIDRISIGYGTAGDCDTNVTPADIAQALVSAAERLDVQVSWTGDTDEKVCLGDASFYDD